MKLVIPITGDGHLSESLGAAGRIADAVERVMAERFRDPLMPFQKVAEFQRGLMAALASVFATLGYEVTE